MTHSAPPTPPEWQQTLHRLQHLVPRLQQAVEALAHKAPAGFVPQLDLLDNPLMQDTEELAELEAEVRKLETANQLLQDKLDASDSEVKRLRNVLLELSGLVDCSIADVEAMIAAREQASQPTTPHSVKEPA